LKERGAAFPLTITLATLFLEINPAYLGRGPNYIRAALIYSLFVALPIFLLSGPAADNYLPNEPSFQVLIFVVYFLALFCDVVVARQKSYSEIQKTFHSLRGFPNKRFSSSTASAGYSSSRRRSIVSARTQRDTKLFDTTSNDVPDCHRFSWV
jgi:hypothetical protein